MSSQSRKPLAALALRASLAATTVLSRLILSLIIGVTPVLAQLIHIGPPDPHACDKVRVQPNLTLLTATRIEGHLDDETGEALAHTRLELRKYISDLKQKPFQSGETDANGDFAFAIVPAGRYRLLTFAPGFRQPSNLNCPKAGDCVLHIRLKAHPTDTFPESVCPPR